MHESYDCSSWLLSDLAAYNPRFSAFPATIQTRTMKLWTHDALVSIEFGHGLLLLKFKEANPIFYITCV